MFVNSAGRFNCGGRCSFRAVMEEGKPVRLVFNPDKTPCVKQCPRHAGYLDTFLSEDRLRYPMKRTGRRGDGAFTRISWEEAVGIITENWKAVKEQHGPASRYVNYSSGVSALARPDYFAKRLLALDGGFLGKYNSYSTACTAFVTPYIYGTTLTGSSSVFLAQSKLIILWGHNPAETIFGAYLMENLIAAKKAGIPIVVLDPRRNRTVDKLNARWIPIRPGTDGALACAMAYEIIRHHHEDRRFLDTFCEGFDHYEDYLAGTTDGVPKSAEWAQAITGIEAETIRGLALEYADAKPAALLSGWGPQRTSNGEQGVRAIATLCCVTGNIGKEGGSAGGVGYVKGRFQPTLHAPPNPVTEAIPSFTWTEAVDRGAIKMILNLGGNTLVNQHSDVNRTAAILRDESKCAFIVVSDLFMTSSARFADVLLPATSFLETANITMPWEEGDYLLHTNKIAEPVGESRFEYDWLCEVAHHLGLAAAFTEGKPSVDDWLRSAYEDLRTVERELPPYETFRADGGYFYTQKTAHTAFKQQIEDFAHNPFSTPSGKIEIYSRRLAAMAIPGIPPIPAYTEGFETIHDPRITRYPFQLIGWHTRRRCHSIHDNNPRMETLDPQCCVMNTEDAARYGVQDGDPIEVFNDRGRIRITARVTDGIMRGVLAIAQGAWWQPDAEGIDRRGNINTLTTLRPTPLAQGNPQHSTLADIKPPAVEAKLGGFRQESATAPPSGKSTPK
ncbi:MAG: molybdopterin-dependent oxidoreductase [Spirochaetaceae bacterium]|jgi:anaerobic dimethyl sulfoxide reductase subunit A|nr:molybdopterin-dependent oxidoreductase [Spirochaetaceae bacterium]